MFEKLFEVVGAMFGEVPWCAFDFPRVEFVAELFFRVVVVVGASESELYSFWGVFLAS